MSDRSKRYPQELRERGVRMVFEHQHEYPSQWKAICTISEQLGVHRESLRVWVRRAEVDDEFLTPQQVVNHRQHSDRVTDLLGAGANGVGAAKTPSNVATVAGARCRGWR